MSATYIVIGAKDLKMIGTACVGFVLMRSLGGYLSVKLKLAKKDGMLHAETKSADGVTKLLLVATMVISICFMAYLNFVAAECIACGVTLFIIYFKNKCYKEFGGINGDTIGYFITEGELIVMCVLALLTLVKV